MTGLRRSVAAVGLGVSLFALVGPSQAFASASGDASCVGQLVSFGAQQIVPFGGFVTQSVVAADHHFGQVVASVTATESDRAHCVQP
jgi:hypothetical protein